MIFHSVNLRGCSENTRSRKCLAEPTTATTPKLPCCSLAAWLRLRRDAHLLEMCVTCHPDTIAAAFCSFFAARVRAAIFCLSTVLSERVHAHESALHILNIRACVCACHRSQLPPSDSAPSPSFACSGPSLSSARFPLTKSTGFCCPFFRSPCLLVPGP